jgi:hypothetical protein
MLIGATSAGPSMATAVSVVILIPVISVTLENSAAVAIVTNAVTITPVDISVITAADKMLILLLNVKLIAMASTTVVPASLPTVTTLVTVVAASSYAHDLPSGYKQRA